MDIKVALDFIRGTPVYYNQLKQDFELTALDQLALNLPSMNLALRQLQDLKEDTGLSKQFALKVKQEFYKDHVLSWLHHSHIIVAAFKALEAPHLLEAVASIEDCQNDYKKKQSELDKSSPYFLKDDRDFVIQCVTKSRYQLMHASKRLQQDPEIVLLALEKDSRALLYTSYELLNNYEFAKAALSIEPGSMQYLPFQFRSDKILALDAVSRCGSCLEFLSDALKDDEEIVTLAIKNSGWSITHASDRLKSSYELSKLAVSVEGQAYCFLKDAFKNNLEIALLAVTSHADSYADMPAIFKSNPDIARLAFSKNGLLLTHAPDEFKTDRVLVLLAISQNALALQYINPVLLEDLSFLHEALGFVAPQLLSQTNAHQAFELSHFILKYFQYLQLHPHSYIVQTALTIYNMSHESVRYQPKSPYHIYNLAQTSSTNPITLSPESIKISPANTAIYPAGFYANSLKLRQSAPCYQDLPAVTYNTLKSLFGGLKARIDALGPDEKKAAHDAIAACSTLTLKGHRQNLLYDAYIHSLLCQNGAALDPAPLDVAALKMILHHINLLDETLHEGQYLSKKDEALIAFSESCRACSGGKKEAILLTYDMLDISLKPFKPLEFVTLHDMVQKLLNQMISDGSSFMHEVTNIHPHETISQLAHQSIYVKNMISSDIGLVWDLDFDLHTMTLYDHLISIKKEDLLKKFYKHFTARHLIENIASFFTKQIQDQKANNSFEQFNTLVSYIDGSYELASCFILDHEGNPSSLTNEGALAILLKAGYVSYA